ncbi:MAG: hypothetical protein AXA67_07895 [Methylothermaceae bacteria B42]|nr:MAG: hypothetical protein AXA67_07895 [Methylothermaceae bacteria B42]HHJ37905.1 TolC family protein [Methylothermaceae bacterium]
MGIVTAWIMVLLMGWSASVYAEEALLMPHHDELTYDPALTLGDVVAATEKVYPRSHLVSALEEESSAWRKRAGGLLAGPVMLGATYSGDQVGDDTGQWSIDTDLTFMIWKWGQRAAAKQVAGQAVRYAQAYRRALKLQVAGLVREALWDLQMKKVDYETARNVLAVNQQLTDVVRKRVEAGDLPRTDLLLAQTHLLQRRSEAVAAEAEWMHARRRYLNLTRMDRAPASFAETLTDRKAIGLDHPLLAAITAKLEEEKARAEWTKFESDTGNQQVYFTVGSHHEHTERGGQTINGMVANLTLPFGGGTYQAPNIASARTALAEAEAERGDLFRRLERDLHEARHALEIARVQKQQAEARHQLAAENLALGRKAFEAGEMNLIDLLKIQLLAQEAQRDLEAWRVKAKSAVAQYNQTVGELP